MKIIKKANDWNGLRDSVRETSGVGTTEMWVLRDLFGVQRLGRHVNAQISSELAKVGLSHFPEELPMYQHERVRLYVTGGAVDRLYKAMLRVSMNDGSALADDTLIGELANSDANEKLDQIRALVCE